MTIRDVILKRQLFNRDTLVEDLSAGLVLGIESIPDGMATGLLALVNPIYGLYGYMVGVFTGSFFTSSVFMSVQATSAMALIIASVPQVQSARDPNTALFTLAILTGLIMLVAGLFKLGSMIRFVPNSVMIGFVNAVAILIILGQLDDFTGYGSVGANKVVKTINLLRNVEQIHLPTLMIGILTIVLILVLEKTSLKSLGIVAAMIIASLTVTLFGADSIALVRDIADIPNSLPLPVLPDLGLIPVLILPAFSLAFVGLIQGASISQSIPNPDGDYPDASGDFVGQGIANLASGLLQGMPVGGSMSATSILTKANARSRFANMSTGIVIALVILLFGRFVGAIAMPALAGLLILVGFRTLKLGDVQMVWKTGLVQQAVMAITFIAALLIPLQYAVLMGVALAIVLFIFQESNKFTVKEWKMGPGQYPVESDPPAIVAPGEITILIPYGSLFYAAASMFNDQLPSVENTSRHAVVIIMLRGKWEVGSTLLDVLDRYAQALRIQNSKLMLVGVDPHVQNQLERTGTMRSIGRKNIYLASEQVGQALLNAIDDAEKWIAALPDGPNPISNQDANAPEVEMISRSE